MNQSLAYGEWVWPVIVVLLCSFCAAQNGDKQAAEPAKFSTRTQLVLIPVLVTDKSGTHVSGLKKEDFTVLENGSERPIATFEEITSDTGRMASLKNGNTFSNYAGDGVTHRVTLIVIDLVNTRFADQAYLKNELLKYLSQSLDRREPTGLLTLDRNGVHLIHDFTSDPSLLIAALHKVRGDATKLVDGEEEMESITGNASPQGSAGDSGTSGGTGGGRPGTSAATSAAMQQEADRMQTMIEDAALNFQSFQQRVAILYTLEGLQQVAQSVVGFPGRKSLIWASGGFPFSVSDTTMQLAPPGRDSLTDVLPVYERTWQVLNDAEIALYPIDVKGLQSSMPSASIRTPNRKGRPTNYVNSTTSRQIDMQSTFETFAAATGGRAYYNSNDLVKGFRDAVHDSTQYYMLGYYLDRSTTKPGWHKLAVKSRREHVNIRSRSGFFIPADAGASGSTNNKDVAAALHSPLDYTSIGMSGRWESAEPGQESGKKRLHYVVELAPNAGVVDGSDQNHVLLDLVVSTVTGEGLLAAPVSEKKIDLHPKEEVARNIREKGLALKGVVEVGPGDYTVHLVVRDELSGRIGSVITPLKVD
jgi:VWFA-related protein